MFIHFRIKCHYRSSKISNLFCDERHAILYHIGDKSSFIAHYIHSILKSIIIQCYIVHVLIVIISLLYERILFESFIFGTLGIIQSFDDRLKTSRELVNVATTLRRLLNYSIKPGKCICIFCNSMEIRICVLSYHALKCITCGTGILVTTLCSLQFFLGRSEVLVHQ